MSRCGALTIKLVNVLTTFVQQVKRAIVWLLTDALTLEIDGVRYVPDWAAIEAVATAAAAGIGLAAIWYSFQALRRQLRHQTETEAKKLEEQLLVRVMDLAQTPYNASLEFIADVVTWRHTGGPAKHPEFLSNAGRKAIEAHRLLSTATASALSVLRRSRPRRFPRGTTDEALARYDDLVQRVLDANGRMLEYSAEDFAKVDVEQFQKGVGADAADMANLLRRVTAEVLARMYSDAPEWLPFQFAISDTPNEDGLIAAVFLDDPPLGTKR